MNLPAPILRLSKLDRVFNFPNGPVQVLKNINLKLSPGECVMVTGPSGSGKSTLLNLAALLDTPTHGEIEFFGEHVQHENPEMCRRLRKKHIGMVFQRFHLLRHRTVMENILFGLRYHKKTPDRLERSEMLLKRLNLTKVAQQPARLLSGGEMQRVAIARAMITNPGLLLADEPTGNLDQESAKNLMDCFMELIQQGVALLLATHNPMLLSFSHRFLSLQ